VELILKATMFLTVIFADIESDGSFNYLFQRKSGMAGSEYMIAHSYPSDMKLKPGDTFYAKIDGKCASAFALDPVPEAMQDVLPFGAPRDAYVCNADSIFIKGIEYKSLIRSRHE